MANWHIVIMVRCSSTVVQSGISIRTQVIIQHDNTTTYLRPSSDNAHVLPAPFAIGAFGCLDLEACSYKHVLFTTTIHVVYNIVTEATYAWRPSVLNHSMTSVDMPMLPNDMKAVSFTPIYSRSNPTL